MLRIKYFDKIKCTFSSSQKLPTRLVTLDYESEKHASVSNHIANIIETQPYAVSDHESSQIFLSTYFRQHPKYRVVKSDLHFLFLVSVPVSE